MPPPSLRDQQLAVERGVEVEGVDEVGEGAGDVVAGARVEPAAVPASATAWTRMPSHFHSAAKSAGSRRAKSPSSSACESMTGRNGVVRRRLGLRAPAGQPGEERDVGRRQAVPELLDLGDVAGAEVGERLLGEAGRDADAQAAGDELEQREAAGGVEAVEQALDDLRRLAARGGVQAVDDLGERRVVGRAGGAGQISAMVSARSPTKS